MAVSGSQDLFQHLLSVSPVKKVRTQPVANSLFLQKRHLWVSRKEFLLEVRGVDLHMDISKQQSGLVRLTSMKAVTGEPLEGKRGPSMDQRFRRYCHCACIGRRMCVANAGTCFMYPSVTRCEMNLPAWYRSSESIDPFMAVHQTHFHRIRSRSEANQPGD